MFCRNPSLRKIFNLYLNPIFLCSMVKHYYLLQYIVSFITSLLIEFLPLILIWLLFFCYLRHNFWVIFFFDPKYPFLPEKNIIITIRTIDCMPTGCMSLYLGFYQVSLAFFPGAAEWHSNNNKIQNQKQTQNHKSTCFVSFLLSGRNENWYSKVWTRHKDGSQK